MVIDLKHNNPHRDRITECAKIDFIAGFKSAQGVNEWGSVDDRLPDAYAEYNVCYKQKAGDWYVFTTYYDVGYKNWNIGGMNITHWQPLPTPPQDLLEKLK